MKVREWMNPEPPTISAQAPVAEAEKLAEEHGLAIVYVVGEEGQLVGFLTRKAISAAPDPALASGKLAAEVPLVLSPDDPLERAVVLLGERHILLPVVEEGKLVGIISRTGAFRALAKMAGFGEEGVRIRIKLSQPSDIYRALEVLGKNELELVAVMRAGDEEVIFHIKGLEDRQRLFSELQEALS